MSKTLLEKHGAALLDKGYNLVPIAKGEKYPRGLKGWEKLNATPELLNEWVKQGFTGVGINAKYTPAVDIDVYDKEVSLAMVDFTLELVGKTAIRVGEAPKALLPYRTVKPFKKLVSRAYKSPDGKSNKIEILGDGQQFVTYHIHPDTRRPYKYEERGLSDIPHDDLPFLDIAMAQKIIARFESNVPTDWVCIAKGSQTRTGNSTSSAAMPLDVTKELLKDVRSALCVIPSENYDEWIRLGHAIKTLGKPGKPLWIEWSETSSKFDKRESISKWSSFNPTATGVDAIFAEAKRLGWVNPKAKRLRVEILKQIKGMDKKTLSEDVELLLSKIIDFSPIAQEKILKRIKIKTGITMGSLWAMVKKHEKERATVEAPTHPKIADAVVEIIGTENVVYQARCFYRWSESGVWQKINDIGIKKEIDDYCVDALEGKFTSNTVNSVFELIKNRTHDENVEFDQYSESINCLNGELVRDEIGWYLEPHDRSHLFTTQLPVEYDIAACAPRFEQFLEEVFEVDGGSAKQKRQIVLEMIGYSFLASCRFEKFIMLIGPGANGKSVLLSVIEALVGRANVSAVQPSEFNNKFQRAHMKGKLVNIVTEVAEGSQIADAELKAIVSGELTTAEGKFKDPFEFHPVATCWFGTNHMPHTRDFSDALFRRAIIIPFNRTFSENDQDKELGDKLLAELPGILNLALDAIDEVLARGKFTQCDSSEQAKDEWRLEANQAAQYIEACCKVKEGHWVEVGVLYKDFERWAREEGIQKRLNKANFGKRLEVLGYKAARSKKGRFRVGLEIEPWFFDEEVT